MASYNGLFGELTDEEIKRYKEAVNSPAEKQYDEEHMEKWPEDDDEASDNIIANN